MSSSSARVGLLDPMGRNLTDAREFARNANAMITLLHFSRIMEQAGSVEMVEALNICCVKSPNSLTVFFV